MQKTPISSEKEALSRAASQCSRRECCISEIREKLILWGQSAEAQERIIGRLLSEGFIDEERFSKAYARDKMRYNHWGRVKIDQMLRQLRIDAPTRQKALEALPDEEYCEILRRVAEQKQGTLHARNDYERRGKLMRFLLSRGFEGDLVRQITGDDF